MHRVKRLRAWAVATLIVGGAMTWLLATAFVGSATGATTASTDWAVVAGAAFTPDDEDCGYDRGNYSGEITSTGGCAMEAGIQLPHGATVTGVFVFYDGNGDSASVHLEENDSFGSHTDIASLGIGGCDDASPPVPCFAMDTSLDSPNIDNSSNSYGIWVSDSGGDITLYRVAVRYTTAVTHTSGSPTTGKAGTSVNPGS